MKISKRDKVDDRVDEILQKLERIKESLLDIQERVESLERALVDRLPRDILTERKFVEEVRGSDEIVEKIIAKMHEVIDASSLKNMFEDKLDKKLGIKPSPVEIRRMERVKNLLQKHGRLSSRDLAKLTGLSRTRCNEYFKQMESLGMVEPVEDGRRKFYRLS